jgi:hypothetical protein
VQIAFEETWRTMQYDAVWRAQQAPTTALDFLVHQKNYESDELKK